MNAVRRKRRQPAFLLDDPSAPDEGKLGYEPPRRWEFEDVDGGIRILPADEAIVVRLKVFSERTFDQIAERLSRSQGTVKAQYYRGLMRLQAYLENRYPEGAHARSRAR
jgi:DNA-directed RNA polymerase specialized sigma24 family protein